MDPSSSTGHSNAHLPVDAPTASSSHGASSHPSHQFRNFLDGLFWNHRSSPTEQRRRHDSGPAALSVTSTDGEGLSPSTRPVAAWGSAYAKCYARRQEKWKRNEEAISNYQGKIPKLEQLFKAIQQGNVEAVRDLVKKGGVDVNSRLVGGSSPLASAVVCSQREIVRLLVEGGADCNQKDGTGTTPLHLSVQWNWVSDSVIIDILLEGKADPNVFNEHGETPLHSAIKRHRKSHVKKFLQRDGNPDKGMQPSGKTPSMLAAESGQLDVLRLLALRHEANLRLRDRAGNTVLHHAAATGHAPVVEFLLTRVGASPNVTNSEKVSPIKVAVSKGHAQVVSLLLSHGAGISLQHRELLASATRGRNADVLRLLFQHGAKSSSQLVFLALEECLLGGDGRGWVPVFQVLLQATGCLELNESNDSALLRSCLMASQLRSGVVDAVHPPYEDSESDDANHALSPLARIVLLIAIAGYPFSDRLLNATRVEGDPFDDMANSGQRDVLPTDFFPPSGFPFPSLHRSLTCLMFESPRSLKQLACLNIRHCASHISNAYQFSAQLPLPKLIQSNVIDLCGTILL